MLFSRSTLGAYSRCLQAAPIRSLLARVLLLAASAGLTLGPGIAVASPPPAALVSGDLFFNFSPPARLQPTDFGTFSLSDPRFGSLSIASIASPFPSASANAVIGINPLFASIFGRSVDVLVYSFELVGPAGMVPVLIDVAGAASGSATRGASFAVESRWNLFDRGHVSLASDDIRSGQLTGDFSQSFNRTVSLALAANQVYSVELFADAASAATDVGSNSIASAFVDPIFSFGPGVDPASYVFNFSAGIGNTRPATGVPEPGTLALLVAGLLGLLQIRSREHPWRVARTSLR